MRNPENDYLWKLESGKVLLLESRMLGFGIQNRSSNVKDCNPVPGIFQNPGMFWMPLPGANLNLLYQAIIIMASSSLYPRSSTKILVLSPPPHPPPTDSKNYWKCVSNFLSSRLEKQQFFFNKPIMARIQILVHRWGLRTRISALFRRRT